MAGGTHRGSDGIMSGFTPHDRRRLQKIGRMDISYAEKLKLQEPIFDEITVRMKRENIVSSATFKLKEALSQAIEAGFSEEDVMQLYNEVVVQHVMEK